MNTTIIAFAAIILLLGAIRIWAFSHRRAGAVKVPGPTDAWKRNYELLLGTSMKLSRQCPENMKARVLLLEAARRLAIEHPRSPYQWRQGQIVDDGYNSALPLIERAAAIAAGDSEDDGVASALEGLPVQTDAWLQNHARLVSASLEVARKAPQSVMCHTLILEACRRLCIEKPGSPHRWREGLAVDDAHQSAIEMLERASSQAEMESGAGEVAS